MPLRHGDLENGKGDSFMPHLRSNSVHLGQPATDEEGLVMRDRDIRVALWCRLEAEHSDDPDTLMLDELSLWHGSTRIDLAVINGEIQGYEVIPRSLESLR